MNLGLFFTMGVSVETWDSAGTLSRELRLYQELLSRGVFRKVYWFTYGSLDSRFQAQLPPGLELVPMPGLFRGRIGAFIYSLLLPFMHRARLRSCDLLKTNQMRGAWAALLASRLYRLPLLLRTGYTWSVSSGSTGPLYRFAPRIERFHYRRCAHATVTSEEQRRLVMDGCGMPEDRVSVVPNWVDVGAFHPDPGAEVLPDRIVFVGRLHGEKNLAALVSSLAGLGIGLDLCHPSDEGRAELEKLGRSHGVGLRFQGRVRHSDLPSLLVRYPVFVLPSLYEGMPKALLEAMACGLCVLATDVPGSREVVEHGVSGWLVEPTVQGLRAGIQHLMRDAEIRAELGRNAARQVRGLYSFEEVFRRELEALSLACPSLPQPKPDEIPAQ